MEMTTGRLKNTYHKIGDNGTEVLLSENTYGERDELQQKRLAGSQEVDYQYNIRLWLTDINDASGCSAPTFLHSASTTTQPMPT